MLKSVWHIMDTYYIWGVFVFCFCIKTAKTLAMEFLFKKMILKSSFVALKDFLMVTVYD